MIELIIKFIYDFREPSGSGSILVLENILWLSSLVAQ